MNDIERRDWHTLQFREVQNVANGKRGAEYGHCACLGRYLLSLYIGLLEAAVAAERWSAERRKRICKNNIQEISVRVEDAWSREMQKQ